MNVVVIYDPVILVVVSNINFLSINYGGRKKKGGEVILRFVLKFAPFADLS
jgi:hypothetical protein